MTNLVNDSIRTKLRDILSDIGPCVNGARNAYTEKLGVYEAYGINVNIPEVNDRDLEEFIVSILNSMCRNCVGVWPKSARIVFRSLEVTKTDPGYYFYVRRVVEDSTLPNVVEIDAPPVNVI